MVEKKFPIGYCYSLGDTIRIFIFLYHRLHVPISVSPDTFFIHYQHYFFVFIHFALCYIYKQRHPHLL